MKLGQAILGGVLAIGLVAPIAMGAEKDIGIPRVTAGDLAKAKANKGPGSTAASIAKGKAIFDGKGACFTCHGPGGKGDGIAAAGLEPSPRNFTNPAFDKVRTEGEMMWVLKNGSPGTAMVPVIPDQISEAEGWDVISYERSLGGGK